MSDGLKKRSSRFATARAMPRQENNGKRAVTKAGRVEEWFRGERASLRIQKVWDKKGHNWTKCLTWGAEPSVLWGRGESG